MLQWVPVRMTSLNAVGGDLADLIEVGGGQLPGLSGKVDVVAVMHLGQVVEAAGLYTHTYKLASMQYRQPPCNTGSYGCSSRRCCMDKSKVEVLLAGPGKYGMMSVV